MVFKVFFVMLDAYTAVCFHLLFVPTSLASLPPGVMFRMHDTKRSATGLKKHTEKCTKRELPKALYTRVCRLHVAPFACG